MTVNMTLLPEIVQEIQKVGSEKIEKKKVFCLNKISNNDVG
jgi:hypothetical protein